MIFLFGFHQLHNGNTLRSALLSLDINLSIILNDFWFKVEQCTTFCRELIYLFTLLFQCKYKMNRREKQAFYFIIASCGVWHLVGIRDKPTCTKIPHCWGQQFEHLPTGNPSVVELMCNLKYLSRQHLILEHVDWRNWH